MGKLNVHADAPERAAGPVVELEPVGERGFEIAVKRGFKQMAPERGVSLEPLVREHLFHERFRRTVVLLADADAYRRQVADEEVDPVIRRDHDKQVGPARLGPPSDLVEPGRQPVAMRGRHGFPIACDDRTVAGRENPDEISHGRSLSVPGGRASAR